MERCSSAAETTCRWCARARFRGSCTRKRAKSFTLNSTRPRTRPALACAGAAWFGRNGVPSLCTRPAKKLRFKARGAATCRVWQLIFQTSTDSTPIQSRFTHTHSVSIVHLHTLRYADVTHALQASRTITNTTSSTSKPLTTKAKIDLRYATRDSERHNQMPAPFQATQPPSTTLTLVNP